MYTPKQKNFSHQARVFDRAKDAKRFGLFWEQGTGKTKGAIDKACYLYERGEIDGVLVVAPNGVHRNWVTDELPTHVPDHLAAQTLSHFYRAGQTVWQKNALQALVEYRGLSFLTMHYEAFITDNGKQAAWEFLRKRRVLFILDEAHWIKTPRVKRTQSIIKAGKYADYRMILTGTPIANSPFDVYSQIRFLDPDFWKPYELDSYQIFKSHFGVFVELKRNDTGQRFQKLERYRRLDELQQIIAPITDRVLKDDVLDLPPKMYQKRYFELPPEWQRHYNELKRNCMTWLGQQAAEPVMATAEEWGDDFNYVEPKEPNALMVTAPLAIVKLLRMQQVTCGYLPADDDKVLRQLPGTNPRLNLLLELVENTQGSIIVWARFRQDISSIIDILQKNKISCVRYDGAVSEGDRALAKERFQKGEVKVFVANPSVGATGLTLTIAGTVIYYNNNFKLVDRLQSEDRAHRIGQTKSVTYIDIVAADTVDERIVEALRKKLDVASQVTGDKLKEWI